VIVIGLLAAIVGVLSAVSVTRSVLRAERKLAASEQGYRTLFEQAGEGILRTDTEGVVLDANPVAAAMFGFEPKELRGVPLEQLFETRSMERQPPQLDRLRRGEVVRSEREAIRRGGGTFPLESVATMVSDGNVVLLCRDMSAHWAQQRELLAARERAELASRAKTVFLDTMTHELRTPLNGIIGAAGVLAEARLTDRAGAMVDDIRDSGRRLLRLLDRILMYTGLEAGRVRPGAESFDLLSTLRVVLGPLAEEAALKGVHLEWEVGAEVPRALNCDVGLLRVVLENLVGNAVKFTEYGAVRVRVRAVGGSRAGGGAAPGGGADCFESFLITVADTGPGMTREELDRLYTPFHQADGSWTRQFGGIGIGLATCRRAVELMGGMLSIEGEPDKGSFAAALLPMAVPGVLRDLAVGHLPPLEPVGLGRRVVVLEPNRAVCEYLRLGLELRGFVPVVPDRGSGEGAFSGGGAEGPLGDFDLTVLGCGLSPTGAFGFDPEAVARPVAVLTIGGGGDPAAQCGRADVAADRPPDLDELASALARAAASGRKGASAA
jgi:PAS domain S-box-containing protein